RLDRRLSLLTRAERDADRRHQTLRGALAWSYDLLDLAEQTLFARLSVFVDGCRLEAAEAVCGPVDQLGIDLLDGIASLVDKSLLRQRLDSDGGWRYWMLETIREFASEQTGNGASMLEALHARWYAGFAEAAAPR